MQERKEIIGRFRTIISSRYTGYGWIAGIIWLIGVLVNLLIDYSYSASVISNGLILFGAVMLWYCFNHRYQLLRHFNHVVAYPEMQLTTYFEEQQTQWEKYGLLRMGAMFLLGMGMLLCLVFWPTIAWARIASSLFISLTLCLIAKGWLDFTDQLLLHDIQRSLKDQTSE